MTDFIPSIRAALNRRCTYDFLKGRIASAYQPGSERAGKRETEWQRFPGICEFADALKVSRGHAWQVLAGKRDSRRLLAAWQKFQRENQAA